MKRFVVVLAAALVTIGAESGSASSSFAIYLVRGERVAPVRRVVPPTHAVAAAAVRALLAGPTAAERRAGYTSAVPAGTRLRGVSLARGIVTVDLSRRFESGGGSESMLLRVAQLVHTTTQFPNVDAVAFRLDGRPVQAIGGEGVVVALAIGRAAFEAQAPKILVEQPLAGDRVAGTLVVRGTVNVFEQQFVIDVTTPGGTLLAHRNVTATAADGRRGTFSARIPLAARASRLVVVAYDRSAKTGARRDVVRVPFTKD